VTIRPFYESGFMAVIGDHMAPAERDSFRRKIPSRLKQPLPKEKRGDHMTKGPPRSTGGLGDEGLKRFHGVRR
jgi:hypothetical protein